MVLAGAGAEVGAVSNHVASLVRRHKTGLGPTAKAVLLLLSDIAADDGSGIWASKQTLANELEMGKRTFQVAIGKLIEAGLLSEVGKRHHSNGSTIEYRIEVGAIRKLAGTKVPKVENTGAGYAPVTTTSGRGRISGTSAGDAPVQEMHVTGAGDAPQDVQEMHPTHPITPLESARPRPPHEDGSRSRGSDVPDDCSDDELFDAVRHAAGVDWSGGTRGYWHQPDAFVRVSKWRTDLGLTARQIIGAVRRSRREHSTPPKGPLGLQGPMEDLAALLKGTMEPSKGERSRQTARADPDRSYLTDLDFTRKAGGTT